MREPETDDSHPAASGALERFLPIFGDVRAGESVTAVLMLANIFLIPGVVFFIWVGVSNNAIIAQFWSSRAAQRTQERRTWPR